MRSVLVTIGLVLDICYVSIKLPAIPDYWFYFDV